MSDVGEGVGVAEGMNMLSTTRYSRGRGQGSQGLNNIAIYCSRCALLASLLHIDLIQRLSSTFLTSFGHQRIVRIQIENIGSPYISLQH